MIKSLNLLPQDLLEKVIKLIKEGKEETALLLLYETLKLSMFHNNLNKCDLFLKEVIENDITNGDVITHTLNALGPIREKLINWAGFIEYSKNIIGSDLVSKVVNL